MFHVSEIQSTVLSVSLFFQKHHVKEFIKTISNIMTNMEFSDCSTINPAATLKALEKHVKRIDDPEQKEKPLFEVTRNSMFQA